MRLGNGSRLDEVAFARSLERAGADALIVHGRTAAEQAQQFTRGIPGCAPLRTAFTKTNDVHAMLAMLEAHVHGMTAPAPASTR